MSLHKLVHKCPQQHDLIRYLKSRNNPNPQRQEVDEWSPRGGGQYEGREEEVTANEYRISFWGENVLKFNNGNGCTTLHIPKTTASYGM